MDTTEDLPETMNFTASEFALGRQRCKKWVCLITQQVSLILKNKLYLSELWFLTSIQHKFCLLFR